MVKNNSSDWAKRLDDERVSKGISLRDLAESAGVTYGKTQQILRGGANCTVKTQRKLAEALGMLIVCVPGDGGK